MVIKIIILFGFILSVNAFAETSGLSYEVVQARVVAAKQEVSKYQWLFISQEEKTATIRRWKKSRRIFTQYDLDRILNAPIVTEAERIARIQAADVELAAALQAKDNFLEQVIERVEAAKKEVANTKWLFTSQEEKDAILIRWKNSRRILTQNDVDRIEAAPIVSESERTERANAAQAELAEALNVNESLPPFTITKMKIKKCVEGLGNISLWLRSKAG